MSPSDPAAEGFSRLALGVIPTRDKESGRLDFI